METIECIPNFSEGKNRKKINAIVSAIKNSHPDIKILDVHCDPDHNRSVITFLGNREAVKKAAFNSISTAANLIDLQKHKGVHPRIGTTDVYPFVPLKGITQKDLKKIVTQIAETVGKKLNIPVHLYEKSAKKRMKKNLANLRSGKIKFKPDFGPPVNKKSGAVIMGVRNILIAYNINLKTDDIKTAKKIAAKIREKNGGLKSVKALGLFLKSKNLAQVSMNITDYKKTSIKKVYETVKKEAKKLGVEIKESEIIGLIPKAALKGTTLKKIKITDPHKNYFLDKA